nr:PDZ domain-containing protein [Gloeomargaritaceae cyanobacterium C42_A2020_066]
MKPGVSPRSSLVWILGVTVLALPAGRSFAETPPSVALKDSPKAVLDEAWQIIEAEYVDAGFNKVDWQQVRQQLLGQSYTNRSQAYRALQQAIQRLGDPYTRFLDPQQYQNLTNQTAGEFSGVGIRLRLDETSKALQVADVMPNSPAAASNLQAGDTILQINQRNTQGLTLEEASRLIRGPVGSGVTFKIQRASETPFTVKVTRALVEVPSVDAALKVEGGRRIGYIRLQGFSAHAADQMRRAIQTLQKDGAQAFILDLRGNPGGLLTASIEISRMWVDQGRIVSTVDRKGERDVFSANGTAFAKEPLVLLVDKRSASASEILAGAIQDNQRGVVIGTPTFGKALVQSVHGLSDGSGLAVTIAHYYTPTGRDISRKGIDPDVALEAAKQEAGSISQLAKDTSSSSDPAYAQAIHYLSKLPLASLPRAQKADSSP